MNRILYIIKKYMPQKLFLWLQPRYHFVFAWLAALCYGFPSRQIIVVGVTGTTGKTSTAYLTAKMLQGAGLKVGYTSTALFGDGEREWLNDKKMTMLGRFFTQKMLRQMITNDCDVAIIETTSEGIRQFRHRFINYDIALFTGLYPEHIESHGSFDNYKKEKLKLFAHTARTRTKSISLSGHVIQKTIIVNGDDEHAADVLAQGMCDRVLFTAHDAKEHDAAFEIVSYSYNKTTREGVHMTFDGADVQLQILGDFTALNAAAAGSIGYALGVSREQIVKGLASVEAIPGRLEKIIANDVTVIVDYAFEPVAMQKLYDTVAYTEPRKIIHVLGGTGGGRDAARRPKIGAIAGAHADYVIVTDEDPYDEDPRSIMEMVAEGVAQAGKVAGKDFEIIEDRREAIIAAVARAQAGDMVLVTGKGCEQGMCVALGRTVPWDDRVVVREALGV